MFANGTAKSWAIALDISVVSSQIQSLPPQSLADYPDMEGGEEEVEVRSTSCNTSSRLLGLLIHSDPNSLPLPVAVVADKSCEQRGITKPGARSCAIADLGYMVQCLIHMPHSSFHPRFSTI